MSGPNKSIDDLDRMGRDAAAKARHVNRTMNGAAPAEIREGLSNMGLDNGVHVPFRVILLIVAILAGGAAGYMLGGEVGMWIGLVAATALGFGLVALVERRAGQK
ncbi:hypothetical protein MWU52_02280 [Jannaschia sp. S6380]|uniref:hypothetical protein n=1 Tax=Jannaschia sp. S6380 TaxID=2926408 RepID=UPI001FF654A1|nr:hypothetical protein [Jannaschia sp. S6380]MCK0166370.1 hypothetical protein [Jannaschia sp. S6380]